MMILDAAIDTHSMLNCDLKVPTTLSRRIEKSYKQCLLPKYYLAIYQILTMK